jgi:hypothetical protein
MIDTIQFGEQSLVYSATDSAGNTGTCTLIVIVYDGVYPTITIDGVPDPAVPLYLERCIGATLPMAHAMDNVDGDISGSIIVTFLEGQFDPNVAGTTVVQYSVTDSSGNETRGTITVIVEDTSPPTIDPIPPLEMRIWSNYAFDLGPYAHDGCVQSDALVWSLRDYDVNIMTAEISASGVLTIRTKGMVTQSAVLEVQVSDGTNAATADVVLSICDCGGLAPMMWNADLPDWGDPDNVMVGGSVQCVNPDEYWVLLYNNPVYKETDAGNWIKPNFGPTVLSPDGQSVEVQGSLIKIDPSGHWSAAYATGGIDIYGVHVRAVLVKRIDFNNQNLPPQAASMAWADIWSVLQPKAANAIEFTRQPVVDPVSLPPVGDNSDVAFNATYLNPAQWKVVVNTWTGEGWKLKPYFSDPLTPFGEDGSGVTDVTTGPGDELWSKIAFQVVPAATLPSEVPECGAAGVDCSNPASPPVVAASPFPPFIYSRP